MAIKLPGVKKITTALRRNSRLYISDWFLKARRYAEASGCDWLILSAQYGLVAPDRVIAPYNRTPAGTNVKSPVRRLFAHSLCASSPASCPLFCIAPLPQLAGGNCVTSADLYGDHPSFE